ncbi:hypothetical protein ABBQ32_011090 [Trebouxia sp. C0010 RCD-2024]
MPAALRSFCSPSWCSDSNILVGKHQHGQVEQTQVRYVAAPPYAEQQSFDGKVLTERNTLQALSGKADESLSNPYQKWTNRLIAVNVAVFLAETLLLRRRLLAWSSPVRHLI